MADNNPEKNRKKDPGSFWSFWGYGFNKARKKSWEKYGNTLIICGLIYLFVAALLPKKYATVELFGFDMSTWIQLIIPSAFLVGFLIYHIVRAPYEIYKEQFEKHRCEIEALELEIKNHAEVKYLEIRPLPVKNTPRYDGQMILDAGGVEKANAAECHIEIFNPNQGVDAVRVRILKIDPPMSSRTESVSTDDCTLNALYFPFTDIPDEALNRNSSGDVCIFKILRTSSVIILRFDGKWNDTCQNSFIPKNEHFITFRVGARNVPQKDYLFKMLFSLDRTRPTYVLKEITPGK